MDALNVFSQSDKNGIANYKTNSCVYVIKDFAVKYELHCKLTVKFVCVGRK